MSMRKIRFRFWEETKLQGILELKQNGIIDMPWQWDKVDQFTGLKDKNGKEIYEGDVLKIVHEDLEEIHTIVEFKKGGFIVEDDFGECDLLPIGWAIESWENDNCEFEVIGNIYENPELLEK